MVWNLDFISEEDFKKHVRATIMKYGEKLESYDLKRFNSNLIDPIKLIFDKSVYRTSWEEIVNNEIFRQRDKSNNNDIGYFHQNIFSYFKGCEVPQAGWDVIYRNPDGIQIGNIIPTWPGANINRGMAHCYDIPNVYYKRHAKFTKLVYGSIYRSVFIEEILENDKYDTVEKLLKLKPEQYVKFLEYIVDVIINRNKQLQDILQEENGHE